MGHTGAGDIPDGRRRRTVYWAIAAGLLVFASRVGMGWDSRRGVVCDELELVLTTADRFLGVPHTAEHWSGAFFQMLLLPVLGCDYLVSSKLRGGPGGFVAWLSELYRSPWHAVWLARVLTSAIGGVGMGSLFYGAARRTGSSTGAALIVLLLAAVPVPGMYSSVASADGPALGLLYLTLGVALLPGMTMPRAGCVGALFGLTLATRTIFAPMGFAILGVVLQDASVAKQRLNRTAIIAISAAIAFVAACPYLWIEPVRFAKATVGNFVKHGEPIGPARAFGVFAQAAPVWLVGLLIVLIAASAVRRKWWATGCVAAAAGVLLLSAARAPEVVPRYFVAVPGIFAALAAVVIVDARAITGVGKWVLAGLASIGVLVSLLGVQRLKHQLPDFTWGPPKVAAAEAVRTHARAGEVVAVPEALWIFLAEDASTECLRLLAEKCEARIPAGRSAMSQAKAFGLGEGFVYAMADNLNEDERVHAARLRAQVGMTERGGLHLVTHSPDATVVSKIGALTAEEGVTLFREGGARVLVTEGAPPPELGQPVWRIAEGGQEYSLFRKD